MPRMMAYLGGDSDTLASRRAKTGDIRLAVEYPDHDRMLVINVMQTGEVVLAFTTVHHAQESEHLEVVGKVLEIGNGLTWYSANEEEGVFAPPTTEPVHFDHTILRVVPDSQAEEEDA